MEVSGTGIPAGANIVTIPNATSFTISSAATGSATVTLTFKTGITSDKIETDAITAAKIVAGAVGISELNATSGITADYHKVPTFANDAARNSAISSPVVGMLIYNTGAGAVQQYNGTWSTIAPAPNITGVSGFLNNDTDSTLSIFGSNFTASSEIKMFDAASGGSQIGSNATTTFVTNAKLKAVFGAGSIGAAGSTAYIEVDNVGATSRFSTAITVNADPVVALSGNTGTGADATDHLGTYGGVVAGGPTDSNTKLLLNFDKDGGQDYEDNSNTGGTGHKTTATGNAVIKTSPFGDGKSAMYFTQDYLTLADSNDWDTGSGEFTIEFWFQVTTTANIMMFGQSSSNGFPRCLIASRKISVYYYDSSGHELNSTTTIELNTWYHFALVRDNTGTDTIRLFINGLQEDIYQTPGANVTSSVVLTIGNFGTYNSQLFEGYMDEFRFVNGTCVYTSNFTPPTTRLTAITNTKLLIHSNLAGGGSSFSGYNVFTDSSASPHTITATGVIHSTLYNVAENTVTLPALTWPASGKTFGSYGAYFDGTGDYLSIPDSSDWDLGTGDFTIDFWAYRTAAISGATAFCSLGTGSIGSYGTDAIYFRAQSATQLNFSINENATNVTFLVDFSFPQNTWTHIAAVRSSGTVTIYANGVSKGSTGTQSASISAPTHMIIGARNGGTAQIWTGYIDIFRFSKGVARWTSAFTPETATYGTILPSTVPTITFTGTTTPALASDEDIEYTDIANTTKAANNQKLSDSGINLTLTNLTGGSKSNATLTGTIASDAGTTHSNMIVKAQVRKTLGDAAYANASRTVTFSSSTTTAGLAPAMPVTGTGIPASTTITSVDTTTTITLSANPTGGTLTGQSLVFEDLTRITHINGSDTLNNADTMMTIATGTGSSPVLFNARRYVGTGAQRTINGFGFQPDMIWLKPRVTNHSRVFDSIRGAPFSVVTNLTSISDSQAQMLKAFHSDGFNLGNDNVNTVNQAQIAWGWKAGTAYTPTASAYNSPTASINVAGGFGIYKVTANSTASGSSISHGLGVAPDMIFGKALANAYNWDVYFRGATSTSNRLILNSDAAVGSGAAYPTTPTSTNFYTGGNAHHGTGDQIFYVWAAVAGVSAFGTYTGTAGANTITYTGSNSFTARWIMVKKISATGFWTILDTFRNGTGELTSGLYANSNAAEYTTAAFGITPTSTGFTMDSGTTGSYVNTSGTYIYCAFA
jgi:hypothetical protein